ncbi:PH domain-containing protein [Flavobacterium sp. MFBS3-15]|uniref:PH domain-containing protein n=1 Tax=Flavobacterium sp. MFBS3-15 TaxID=2989816 RepID=UPI002236C144|nr:PH domain-containing protein [Flavobacterium sp. MFBS3-15]MCW4467962.1 PH domain-containing protein [Flavobacterium sp. MFBS3-15]
MNNDFSRPQRQSLVGVVVMFGNTLQKMARALWPILLGMLFKFQEINKLYLLIGSGVFFVFIAVIAYLKYLNFTFYLDEENQEFIVKDGIINKSRLAIPLDKIQQVNINQSLVQRLIGVHALEVDTAGTGKQEVSIKAIPHDLAIALKARLHTGSVLKRDFTEETQMHDAVDKRQSFIEISLLSLLKAGVTSNYARTFALLLAFVITTSQHIDEFLEYSGYDFSVDEYITAEMVLKFLTFIIVGVMALILVVNLARTIIKFFGYRITKQDGSLLLSYGLINTKSTILKPEKVQIVRVTRNFFQKKLNIRDLHIRQASNMEASAKEQKKTAIEIPGCDEREKDILLQFIFGGIPEKGVMLKPNFRKMIFPAFFWLVLPLSVYFWSAYKYEPELYNIILIIPVYALFVMAVIYFGFRNSRLFVNDDFIIKQGGAWDIDNDFLEPHKIHTVSLTQYFWQKGSDVGIVSLHTAGGTISFGLANYTRLKQLANYWLYQVETTEKHWM